jgi:hypothetical protein
MRKLAMIGIAFLLVVSIAYAGVLSYYGKIVGNVNVQGPIFYADLTNEALILNRKPTNTTEVSFTDSSKKVFRSDNLGSITFNYVPRCDFSVKIYSNSSSQVIVACYYNDYNDLTHKICETTIDTTTTYQVLHNSCNGTSVLTGVNYIIYEISGTGEENITYYLETNPNGDTKLQLNKVS